MIDLKILNFLLRSRSESFRLR
ncbi:hypothetical protein NC652_031815 [Populus alba x Populus x berolinensis]|nr:hypothetical protein NC652_031813 [Populus alba x Populus x berolinensis]KAJ6884932.1 hypothetical protein NC652_031815 [Populus alba x Populus x berolinensis]